MTITRPAGWLTAFCGGSLVLTFTPVLASGYHFGSQSVSAQGTAHANGAEAADPSVIFYNPAGLARLKGTQMTSGLSILLPKGEYEDKGSTDVFGNPTGTGDGDAGSYLPDAAAPNFYFQADQRPGHGRAGNLRALWRQAGLRRGLERPLRHPVGEPGDGQLQPQHRLPLQRASQHRLRCLGPVHQVDPAWRGRCEGASRQLAGQFVAANQDVTELAASLSGSSRSRCSMASTCPPKSVAATGRQATPSWIAWPPTSPTTSRATAISAPRAMTGASAGTSGTCGADRIHPLRHLLPFPHQAHPGR